MDKETKDGLIWFFSILFGILVSVGAVFALYSIFHKCPDTAIPNQAPAAYYSYTVNGHSYDYATGCFVQSGSLFCDAEDGTRLKVDSYTPVYWEQENGK